MSTFYAIDPGDKHVGLSLFVNGECVWALETDPLTAMQHLSYTLEATDVVVVERYQLYPHLAQTQQGSDMRTSQMIGALKWLAYQRNVPVVIQQAALKKPTEALIQRRGITRKALGKGDHAKDSETHGYTYLFRSSETRSQQAPEHFSGDLFRA